MVIRAPAYVLGIYLSEAIVSQGTRRIPQHWIQELAQRTENNKSNEVNQFETWELSKNRKRKSAFAVSFLSIS